MKKFGCILTALLLCLSLSAHAEGLTLYTVSSFAGTDAAADSYVERFVGQNLLRRLGDLHRFAGMAGKL